MRLLFLLLAIIVPTSLPALDFVEGELMGQLGNQMFIIAATESLARDNGAQAVFPDLVKKTDWNIQENRREIFFRVNSSRPTKKIRNVYYETQFNYKKIPYRKNMLLHGYFQSEKYFHRHKKEIIDLFSPSDKIVSYLQSKYLDIISHPNTVSIHFRDYLKEDPEQKCHPNCTKDYFIKAIEIFPIDSLFIIFSNNIDWCKKEFADIPRQIRYVENEHFFYDFYLMSMCKNNIISNSSFSWWAAYLNLNEDKVVVAPRRWFVESYESNYFDLLLPEWRVIDL